MNKSFTNSQSASHYLKKCDPSYQKRLFITNTTHLIRLVREVYFVEYLRGLVLYRLNLDVMGRVLPLAHPGRPLDPLEAVQRDRVTPGVEEVGQFLKQSTEILIVVSTVLTFMRLWVQVNSPVASQSSSQPRSSLGPMGLSVSCFMIWQ